MATIATDAACDDPSSRTMQRETIAGEPAPAQRAIFESQEAV